MFEISSTIKSSVAPTTKHGGRLDTNDARPVFVSTFFDGNTLDKSVTSNIAFESRSK